MGLSFSVKVAPGVRVRASSRGVRTSIGPRAARVHVGGGRTSFSTGAGPLTYSTSLSGSRARTGGRRTSAASYQRQLSVTPAAAAKAEETQRLAKLFQELLDIHRADFPSAQPPLATPAPEPDVDEIRRRHAKAATDGLGFFQRAAKAAARAQAEQAAEGEIQAQRRDAARKREGLQADLDAWWRALVANDPETVIGTLAEAFEDNEAAAAPLGVDGEEVAIVVLAPPESVVPERMPGTTAAGNLSLRKLPKGERAAFYTMAVMGHVVVTIREALAVAPGLRSVRVVALRWGGTGCLRSRAPGLRARRPLDPRGVQRRPVADGGRRAGGRGHGERAPGEPQGRQGAAADRPGRPARHPGAAGHCRPRGPDRVTAEPTWMTPPEPQLQVGDEPIVGADASLSDFWAWCLSDLRTNTVRPMLAEFLVARALGAATRPRIEWDAYDVLTLEGVKVEVKSGSYLQAWEQSQLSKVVFGGLKARRWTAREGYSTAGSYNADVYVFAVQTAKDHAGYDALDLAQWSFWVLPRAVVEETGQRSMQLPTVESLGGPAVTYAELADRVRRAAGAGGAA